MPGIRYGALLICSPSARYHYGYVRNRIEPDVTVVWRAIPRHDRLPAHLGWQPEALAAECLNLWDEQAEFHTGVEHFLPLNELQFLRESGEAFPGYGTMAQHLDRLLPALRAEFARRGQTVRLHFPAWVPQDEMYHLDDWRWAAERWDVIHLHCYGSAEVMRERYDSYRAAFPGKAIFVGEHNANREGHDERATLEMWAQVAASDPLFLGATYYIWETRNAGEHELSIWGNGDRYGLFLNPPAAVEEAPEFPPKPGPDPGNPPGGHVDTFPLPVDDNGHEWQATTEQVMAAIMEIAPQEIDPADPTTARILLTALGIAESGEDFQSQERWHIWTGHGKAAVEQRNLGYAAQVLGWGKDVGEIGTNDYSAGPFHQAWPWWDQFPGDPTDPNDPHRWDVLGWLNFRKLMIQDHGYATRYAARRIAVFYRQNPTNLQWCLERYNKPSGEVSAGVRANYERALRLARAQFAGVEPPPVPPSGVRYDSYPDPYPWGTFIRQPKGVILHGSRSGKASNALDAEYAGTAGYEQANSFGSGSEWYKLGWNATIGDLKVAVHMDARHWGYNARAASDDYLAVEFAQPTRDNQITDGQIAAFVDWYRTHVLSVWPDLQPNFPTHAEVEQRGETGARDGKDDVFPYGSAAADEVRERILAMLAQPGEPPAQTETDQEKIRRMISAIGYLGGDVADRFELSRASLDDGAERPHDDMTREEALAALAALWQNVDRVYAELGAHGAELRRVRDEQLE